MRTLTVSLLGLAALAFAAAPSMGDQAGGRDAHSHAFDQCAKALSPIITRARLDAQVIIEILEMNCSSFTKCHFGRHFAVAPTLSMLF